MDVKTLSIALLTIGIAVLGYLYYQETNEPTVKVDLPGIKIEGR